MKRLAAALSFFLAASAASADPAETFVEAPGPLGPLKGTKLAPADANAPIVLIVPGSGSTDRDGDNPLGVKASSYRLLAEGLLQRGVASVRIDKRGMFASAAAIADANDVTIEAYAADVHSWIDAIRKLTGRRCLWVLGHSEGGLVALAAAQNSEGVCGLVLVATAGRPIGQVVREQLKTNPANAPLIDDAERAIARLENGEKVDVAPLHPALRKLFSPAVQGFWISEMRLDPAKLAAAYAGPVLILQGDKDIQIGVADAERLKATNPSAKLTILPGINHVLKYVADDDRGANLATYADPSLPLGPGVVDAVADFVTGRH